MKKNLLVNRLTSIEKLEETLRGNVKGYQRHKTSEYDLIVKRVTELEGTIQEALTFFDEYKKELRLFLKEDVQSFEDYQNRFKQKDEKFYDLLHVLQKKELSLKALTD